MNDEMDYLQKRAPHAEGTRNGFYMRPPFFDPGRLTGLYEALVNASPRYR